MAMSIQKEHEFNIKRGLAIPVPDKPRAAFFTEKRAGACLFCQNLDGGKKNPYRPSGDVEFICSGCVQHLLNADQQYLKLMHSLATEHGDKGKISAIESFFIMEEEGEQRKPITKKRRRHSNRKGTVRSVGNKKERLRHTQAEPTAAVL